MVENSAGAVITLKLAAARPELLRGIMVHEPPLWSLLAEGSPEAEAWAAVEKGPWAEVLRLIEAGDHAGAAELFVDRVALGPGSWARMPEAMRQMMTRNAPTKSAGCAACRDANSSPPYRRASVAAVAVQPRWRSSAPRHTSRTAGSGRSLARASPVASRHDRSAVSGGLPIPRPLRPTARQAGPSAADSGPSRTYRAHARTGPPHTGPAVSHLP
ncbi:hypothetical protein GCM10025762_33720 [Haloechinothrix salitolerans]